MARDVAGQAEAAERLITAATEHAMPHFRGLGLFFRADAMLKGGRVEEGLMALEVAKSALLTAGTSYIRLDLLLAEARMAMGRPVPVADLINEVARLEAVAGSWSKARNYCRVGTLLQSLAKPDEAEACFQSAIQIARGQEAKCGSCGPRAVSLGCGANGANGRRHSIS